MPSTTRKVWQLTWPVMLSNISTPLLGLVDTAVLGHLNHVVFLGALALCTSSSFLIFWSFGFLKMGTTALVSQAYGQRNQELQHNIYYQSTVFAVVLGFAIILLSPFITTMAIHLMGGSKEVTEIGREFLTLRLMSAPAVLTTYVIIGWFVGRQDTRTPLFLVIVTNIINAGLDYLLVYKTSIGAIGVIWASLIAEYTAMFLGAFLIWQKLHVRDSKSILKTLLNWQTYSRIIKVNKLLFVRTLILLLVMTSFTAIGLRHGDAIAAANAILLNFLSVIASGLDGFAHAAEGMVGEAWGQENRQKVLRIIKSCLLLSLVTALLFSVVFALFGKNLIDLLTNQPGTQNIAYQYILWIIALPLVAVWSYFWDGVFVGAGLIKEMRDVMIFSAGIFYFPIVWLTLSFGNEALWASFFLFMIVRASSMSYLFYRTIKTPIKSMI